MKRGKYPRLRTKTYKGSGGQVWTYWLYDMRGTGKPDVRLGKDYAIAIEAWHKLHNHLPMTVGRVQEAADRWRERELPKYDNAETKKSYERQLGNVVAAFGRMAWHEITLPVLRQYLDARSAKIQGNRELSVLSIVWSKARLWGMTELHWPAAGVKNWKNEESERDFEVTDALFTAVYSEADQVLRDCMDIATSTGMRLTDARTVRMPVDGLLRHKSRKTGKWSEFEVVASPVLSALVQRREAVKAYCVMLLATNTGHEVTMRMLRERWDNARDRAALKAEQTGNKAFGKQVRAMYLRDMRSRAADLAGDIGEASKLLQHSSETLTRKHYRTKADKLRAVR
jgi:hypothetical protein